MNIQRIDQLEQKCFEQEQIIEALKGKLMQVNDERKSAIEIHEEFKTFYERSKKEIIELNKKLNEAQVEKKDLERQFKSQLAHFKTMLDDREKHLDNEHYKALQQDNEVIKAKLTQEIEIPLKAELAEIKSKNEQLRIDYYSMKKDLMIFKTMYNELKSDSEENLEEIKKKNKAEVLNLMNEIEELHKIIENSKLHSVNNEMVNLIETRRNLAFIQRDNEELKKQRDELLIQNNEQSIKINSIQDNYEREKKRLSQELDDYSLQISSCKQEKITLEHSLNLKLSEIANFKEEKLELTGERKRNNIMIESLEKEKIELTKELNDKIKEIDHLNHLLVESEKDKVVMERRDHSTLQEEVENKEKLIKQIQLQYTSEANSKNRQIDELQNEIKLINIGKIELNEKYQEININYEALKQNFKQQANEKEDQLKEIKRLGDEIRQLIERNQNILNENSKIELISKQIEVNYTQLNEEKKQILSELERTQKELNELIKKQMFDKNHFDQLLEISKTRAEKYKAKVREANKRIKSIADKLGHNLLLKENMNINMGNQNDVDLFGIMKNDIFEYQNQEVKKNN